MDYYILSIKHATRAQWWGPKEAGYCTDLRHAGVYREEEVFAKAERLNNGVSTVAIPCFEVDRLAQLAVPDDTMEYLIERSGKRVA